MPEWTDEDQTNYHSWSSSPTHIRDSGQPAQSDGLDADQLRGFPRLVEPEQQLADLGAVVVKRHQDAELLVQRVEVDDRTQLQQLDVGVELVRERLKF